MPLIVEKKSLDDATLRAAPLETTGNQKLAFTPKKAWKYGAWKPSGSSYTRLSTFSARAKIPPSG